MYISLFKSAMDTTPQTNISFYTFLGFVKDGKWEDLVHEVRTDKRQKKTMPAVTPSGTFVKRNADGIEQHSNIISIDIDYKDNEDADIEALKQDQYTWAVHRSIGGRGWVAYFKIEPSKHLQAYYGLEKYLADNYRVVADKSCKDVSRLRYVSWDPDLYQKQYEPKTFKLYIKDVAKEIEKTPIVASNADYQYIINQIEEKRIDLTNSSYHDWVQIGFSLANGLGEQGRDIFHAVSRQSAKYDEFITDAKYTNLVKNANGATSLNTFFYLCSQAGISTQTEQTRKIIAVTQLAKARDSQNESQAKQSILKTLEKEGITGSGVTSLVDQSWNVDIKSKKVQKSAGEIEAIKSMLHLYNLKYNLVTQSMEIDGRNFTDREFNTIFVQLREQLGNTVQSQLVNSIIDSDNTPSFNPFTEYLQENTFTGKTGYIDQVCDCIVSNNPLFTESTVRNFVRKWLLSIIASMHGTHSVLILVLCGGQGIGKTNFFRHLLPEKLRRYYAESKLDLEKDDMILMCNKLIICDDEFGGKSKKEEKQLKNISSKQEFSIRPPYHRRPIEMTRFAVLCGTSNDNQVLNDLTGNRRIIPIDIKEINVSEFKKIDKDLLFAELYNEYLLHGDEWQLNAVDIAILDMVTESNKMPSLEEESIFKCFYPSDYTSGEAVKLTPTEILDYIGDHSNLKLSLQKLGLALKNLGYVQTQVRFGKKTHRVYEMRKKML